MDAATFSAVAEKAEVYFSNIARLSSRMRINSAAPTVLVTIIGAAMLCTRCRASSERAGNQQNDHHLHQLGHEGDRPGGQRAKDFVRPAAFDQHAVHQTAQQSLNDGGDHAT